HRDARVVRAPDRARLHDRFLGGGGRSRRRLPRRAASAGRAAETGDTRAREDVARANRVDGKRLGIWLERGETETGRGFWLRDAATGEPLGWSSERLAARGAGVIAVAGASHRADALQDDAFEP